jgi:hypothetical protein
MRDDLHRTPALPRSWRSAVRHAARQADAALVAYDMSRAAKQQLDVGLREEFVNALGEALGGNHGQLFPESRLDSLRTIEQLASHPVERSLVETARALCLRNPETSNIVQAAQGALFNQIIDNTVEHITAAVRIQFGTGQSAPLRMRLLQHRAECSIDLGSQRRPKRLSDAALLDLDVPSP